MNAPTPSPTAYLLAYEFAALLRNELTADQMEAINRRNRAQPGFACATHDFCDPNEVMIQAMGNIDMEFQPDNEVQAQITNAAWDIAKRHGFEVQAIGVEATAAHAGWPENVEPPRSAADGYNRDTGLCAEHLDQAYVGADHCASDLIDANRVAGPVESLLILPLIARVRALQQEIAAIRDAIDSARGVKS